MCTGEDEILKRDFLHVKKSAVSFKRDFLHTKKSVLSFTKFVPKRGLSSVAGPCERTSSPEPCDFGSKIYLTYF
jgi:hypothetical protein